MAREKSATLILEAVDFELGSSLAPVFLLGDLNSPESGIAYQSIAGRMHDLREICPTKYGHYNTCTGFEGKKSDLSRIDHIFGSMADGWNGKIYAVEENRFEDGIWLSDHRLVMADVYIERQI